MARSDEPEPSGDADGDENADPDHETPFDPHGNSLWSVAVHQSSPKTSPPAQVPKAIQTSRLTVSETNRTEPSAKATLTTPEWSLRAPKRPQTGLVPPHDAVGYSAIRLNNMVVTGLGEGPDEPTQTCG